MSEFGWTRLAYLTVILTALAVLVKLGTFGANSITENFPESALAFNQGERAVEEQYREEKRDDKERDDEERDAVPRSERDHGEEEHSEEPEPHDHESVEGIYENVNFAEDAPVFYRPAPRVSGASAEPAPEGKSCQTVGDAPPGSEILFPVTREHFDSYEDTWGAARPQGGHEGTDLMVPTGTPLLAMTDARVVPVSGANGNGWNTLGGYTVMLEAAYSVGPVKEGDLFYYAHMDEKSALRIGDTVEAGDVVGYAGDTGQGPEVSRGQFPPHLHLGWYETSGERSQLASGAMNPYPLLEWVKANGGAIEGGSDIPYCEAPQSSAPTPSGGGYWQFPSDPSVRPDIATGNDSAAPSPIVESSDSVETSPDITREPRRNIAPPRPERPDPPQENESPRERTDPGASEPPSATPPSNGRPSIPNIPNPLPGIGNDIRDVIVGILNPRPPRGATGPTNPAPPEKTEDPKDANGPENPPLETTTPDVRKDGECEPRERGDGEESGGEPRSRGEGEECSEDANVEDSPPEEETTGEDTSDAVEGQYGESSNPEAEKREPETTSGSASSDALGGQYEDGRSEKTTGP